MKYFALTSRGLESIAKEELCAKLQGITIEDISYRKILFSYSGEAANLLQLHAVEDVFLLIGTIDHVGHTEPDLAKLVETIASLNFRSSLEVIGRMREEGVNAFSISSSSVGKRNFSYIQVKEALRPVLEKILHVGYEDELHQSFDVRIFLEHDIALIGVRLATRPLHRRVYKQHTTPGTLPAPIAYAMSFVAHINKGDTVLDPMLGSGTLLFEAAEFHPVQLIGGDIIPEAVAAAQTNAANLPLTAIEIQQWDATALPLQDKSVDVVLTQFPFSLEGEAFQSLAAAVLEELCRVSKGHARMVLMVHDAQAFEHLYPAYGLHLQQMLQTSLSGKEATIFVLQN